jgi:hypothetical protein
LTLQVKYLAECVENLIRKSANSEPEPYGVPGPSRPPRVGSGSQEEPIVISDGEIIIKMEIDADANAATSKKDNVGVATEKSVSGKKSKESISGKESKRAAGDEKSTKKTSKSKGKAAVRISDSSSSSDSDSSSSSNSSSGSSVYLKKSDMPKDLREALRVNKDTKSQFTINLFTDIINFI